MKDLLEFMAKSLADRPEEVHVEEYEKDNGLSLWLRLAVEDYGKIIGKKGRNISAIRTLVRAAALRQRKPVEIHLAGQEAPASL
jgi:uncharacterized protein